MSLSNRRALFVHASSDLYGSDRVALAVVEAAVAAGWTVEFTVPAPGPMVERVEAAGAEVWELDPLKPRRADLRPTRVPVTAAQWWRESRRLHHRAVGDRADLVYTTTAPTVGGALLARRWRVPHVYHVHEIFWFPAPAVRAFERVLERADDIICCSRAVRDQFRRPQVLARSRVVYSGAQVDPHPETEPLSRARTRLICVGRLNEWKGQEVLVGALRVLRDDGVDVDLTLVGGVFRREHHFERRLRALVAELGLEDRVELTGERRDAHALVAQADVFVLPSRRPEPFGMALVEAMLLGRPVVATAAGGPLEFLTDRVDGLLVPPGDATALAGAVRRLLSDPDQARRMAAAGRDRAKKLRISDSAADVVRGFDALVPPS